MNEELEQLFLEYSRVMGAEKINPEDIDYAILDKHIEFLKKLDLIENSSISVFDLYKREHVFVSSNFSNMLGYNLNEVEKQGNDYFNSKVHPEDFPVNLKVGIELFRQSVKIPVEERKNYKLVHDYRIKNGSGKYIRVIEQQQALELDKKGKIWLALSTVDFSPDQDLNTGPRFRIYNFKTGEIMDPKTFTGISVNETKLSRREQEILKLVKEGLPSKEIAEKLFISVHTVNTHRQRILEKLNVTNSFEAIQYASGLGLMD
ncbi:MAG: PAS domain-containing protein [Prolixibacteraceae bacterium]|nr:PAS domain-containing protein [Prolixibacteraceae bacterium]MBN2774280.1 PAS domain-containing protein [Prolixibacteraceae bacterium]